MVKYELHQVRSFLGIYGNMVHQSNVFEHGVIVAEHRAAIEKTIYRAKHEFPRELKNKEFKFVLNKLERIVKFR